jgi:uncharacterized protein (UPF0548 family)
MRRPLLAQVDEATALNALRGRTVNYDPARAPMDGRPAGHWHVDADDTVIGLELPGDPVPGGPWETACLLVRQYEFAEPRILRAAYRGDDELAGRYMLLEGRFFGLRFYLGVRVDSVTDTTRDGSSGPERVWGWSYLTLQGHLEQGRLSYEVIKNLASGQVTFRVAGYSRRAPIPNPLIRLGFVLFGRWTQRRFYRAIQARLRRLIRDAQHGEPLPRPEARPDGIVIAPSGAGAHPLERLARGSLHPGRLGATAAASVKPAAAGSANVLTVGDPGRSTAMAGSGPVSSKQARSPASGRGSVTQGTQGPDLIGIYLNDHLAGATGGTELARRAAAATGSTAAAGSLRRFATEVAQDRAALLRIMATLGVPVRRYKVYAAWIGEKAGRLKFNGHLTSRSPLSGLEELEMLRLGVEGKAAGWRTLRALADTDARLDPHQLDGLIERARSQSGLLEELRIQAAADVIATHGRANSAE